MASRTPNPDSRTPLLPTPRAAHRTSLAPFLLALLVAANCSAQTFEGAVTDVRVVRSLERHPDSAQLWEPYIAQWKERHLVVAFGVRLAGKTDMGDIYASVSTDDGDTWQPPAPVFDHQQRHGALQFAYANPVLYKPPGQDVLWCFAMRCPMNYRHSEDSQLVGAFSADGGRSWSPVELAMSYTGPLIVVAGIQRIEREGRVEYLFPAHRNTRRNDPLGTRDQLVLRSTSLLEWGLAGHIPQPESGPVFLHEGNIAPGAAPGELKMVMRTANYEDERLATDPPRAYSSVSRDGGRTWTPAREEPALWNAKSKGYYTRTGLGSELYIYNDGPAGSRMALRFKVRPAAGEWGAEQTFYDAGVHNSYPTLIEIAPGVFRAVWDSGTADQHRTHIRFGKFKLGAGG